MGIPSRLAIYKGVQMPQGGGWRELRAAVKLRRTAPGREGSYRPVPATPDAKRRARPAPGYSLEMSEMSWSSSPMLWGCSTGCLRSWSRLIS